METYNDEHTHEQDVDQDALPFNPEETQPVKPEGKERRAPESAVDAVLAAARVHILSDDGTRIVRKPIAVTQQDRKKVRRRNVDTDVPVSDLVSAAVVDLLKEGTTVEHSNRKRPATLTIGAPDWWWELAKLHASANGAQLPDVIAAAIGDHLP